MPHARVMVLVTATKQSFVLLTLTQFGSMCHRGSVPRLSMPCGNGCRIKTAFMTATSVGHVSAQPDRLALCVENELHCDVPMWDDADGQWWRTIPARNQSARRNLASSFQRFVRAYCVAIVSGADGEDALGQTCQQLMSFLEGRREAGLVPMSAVVESFQQCPGDVFFHTLALLKWVGHIKCLKTLEFYKYACMMYVKAYIAHQCRVVAAPVDKVCTSWLAMPPVFGACGMWPFVHGSRRWPLRWCLQSVGRVTTLTILRLWDLALVVVLS